MCTSPFPASLPRYLTMLAFEIDPSGRSEPHGETADTTGAGADRTMPAIVLADVVPWTTAGR